MQTPVQAREVVAETEITDEEQQLLDAINRSIDQLQANTERLRQGEAMRFSAQSLIDHLDVIHKFAARGNEYTNRFVKRVLMCMNVVLGILNAISIEPNTSAIAALLSLRTRLRSAITKQSKPINRLRLLLGTQEVLSEAASYAIRWLRSHSLTERQKNDIRRNKIGSLLQKCATSTAAIITTDLEEDPLTVSFAPESIDLTALSTSDSEGESEVSDRTSGSSYAHRDNVDASGERGSAQIARVIDAVSSPRMQQTLPESARRESPVIAHSHSQLEESRDTFRALTEDVLALMSDAICLLYTSPSPRDATLSRMPSSA